MARKVRVSSIINVDFARKTGKRNIKHYIHESILQQRINRIAMRRTKAVHQ